MVMVPVYGSQLLMVMVPVYGPQLGMGLLIVCPCVLSPLYEATRSRWRLLKPWRARRAGVADASAGSSMVEGCPAR